MDGILSRLRVYKDVNQSRSGTRGYKVLKLFNDVDTVAHNCEIYTDQDHAQAGNV